VLAATAGAGAGAMQLGALVKLLRVMMLGPVVLLVGLLARDAGGDHARPALSVLVPWFVLGFFALAVLRSTGLLPPEAAAGAAAAARPLTLLAMAGLGATVDLAAVVRAGPRLLLAVSISILALGLGGLGLIFLLRTL